MGRIKNIQLYLHQHYSIIRQGIVIVVGIILLIASMVTIASQNRLIEQVRGLSEQNKVLSEQNKVLNQQTNQGISDNQKIAKQNRSYSRCIAEIFAKYTQNFIPIKIIDLDTCTTDSQTKATNDTSSSGTTPAGNPAPSRPNTSSTTPATTNTTPTTPTPPPDNNIIGCVNLIIVRPCI